MNIFDNSGKRYINLTCKVKGFPIILKWYWNKDHVRLCFSLFVLVPMCSYIITLQNINVTIWYDVCWSDMHIVVLHMHREIIYVLCIIVCIIFKMHYFHLFLYFFGEQTAPSVGQFDISWFRVKRGSEQAVIDRVSSAVVLQTKQTK